MTVNQSYSVFFCIQIVEAVVNFAPSCPRQCAPLGRNPGECSGRINIPVNNVHFLHVCAGCGVTEPSSDEATKSVACRVTLRNVSGMHRVA